MIKAYAFVLDASGKKLDPTPEKKAWYLIRNKKATIVQLIPLTIKLYKTIPKSEVNSSRIILGIDDGSKFTGLSLVQECKTKNKPLFKGTIEHRQDVKHLMDVRRRYRRYRRNHKRYRKERWGNRASMSRKGRIAPSIKQKKDATLRTIHSLNKLIRINNIVIEDVQINIRALTEGYKPYRWNYQKSNRLDENIRKATILRDKNTCVMCEKSNCQIEVHHITPRRLGGPDSINNLCCLCSKCHKKVTGKEEKFKDELYSLIDGRFVNTSYAQHVMQGKTYLRDQLIKIAPVNFTTGGETANRRIDYSIDKSHANDATVITGLALKPESLNIYDWTIKPMRRKSKAQVESVLGFKHRDLIRYTKKNGDVYIGYITALYPDKKQINLTTIQGKILKRYGLKSCDLIWRFNKIYYLK